MSMSWLKLVVISLFSVSVFLSAFQPANAQVAGPQPWDKAPSAGGESVCVYSTKDANNNPYNVATIQGAQCLVANVLSVAVTMIGLAGFVMILIGSFRYLVSGGNTKDTDSARQTITFAIFGLVIALSAFIILNLIAAFTGVSLIKQFTIPNSETQWTDV